MSFMPKSTMQLHLMAASPNYLILFLLLCLIYSPLVVNAQVETVQAEMPKLPIQTSIGVNISGFSQKLLRLGSDSIFQNPYDFEARFRRGKIGVSVGLGGTFKNSLDQQPGFADYRKVTNSQVVSRVSFDLHRDLSQKWLAIFSIDGVYGKQSLKDINETGIDRVNLDQKTATLGGGPRIQLQYAVAKRISLGMETYAYVQYETVNSERTFRNQPALNDLNIHRQQVYTQKVLPLALFAHITL